MKLHNLLLIISFIISLFLYSTNPIGYSLPLCFISFCLFVVSFVILYINKCKDNIICFDFIFSLTFFFVNYAYPLIYYPINPYFSLFNLEFPENYITKGTVLATIGYISYCYGSTTYKHISSLDVENIRYKFRERQWYTPITIFLTAILTISIFPILLSGVYDGKWGDSSYIKVISDYLVFYLIFTKLSDSTSLKRILYKNKIFFIVVILYLLVFVLIGNRTIFLAISLLTIFTYTTFHKKIKQIIFIPIIICGFSLMYYIGSVRGDGMSRNLFNKEIPAVIAMGEDLTINSRSLYVLMEYVDKKGYTYGKTWLMNILSIFPFGQNIYLDVTNSKLKDINSANLVTDLYYNNRMEKLIGLGTNLIGDIYLCFGLLGVIFFMYILGKIISYSFNKGMLGDTRYLFLYAILFMDCIFLCRSGYLTSLRSIVWCFALYYFAKKKRIA